MSDEDKAKYDAWLDNPNTILGEGAGIHDATKFKVCSYYWKYEGEWLNLPDDERFERALQWHHLWSPSMDVSPLSGYRYPFGRLQVVKRSKYLEA